jgi:curved DNA-binding protein CbpA
VTHYEVLGVDPRASTEEIRRAYLAGARRHHPDRLGDAEAPSGSERMLQVNEAWSVLSDRARRTAYDRSIGIDDSFGGEDDRFGIRDLDSTFVPYDDHDDDDDDSWRYEPDEGDPRTAPSRQVVLAPVVLGAAALLAFAAWILLDDGRIGAVAAVLGMLTIFAFLLVPLIAMARAARFERR